MKKILLGFFGGLFIAFVIYIVWEIYKLNTIDSRLPPSLRQESVEQGMISQFERADRLIEEAKIADKNGNVKEKCYKLSQAIRLYRKTVEFYDVNYSESDLKEMEADLKKMCP
jgi:hypothetical protein